MSWLDKLLGRGEKSDAPTAAPTAPEAPPAPESPPMGESGAEEARDDDLDTENRVPPGTG